MLRVPARVDTKAHFSLLIWKISNSRPNEEGTPHGWGIELCGSFSCLEGLRSLLNTEGILTLPMFC